MSSTIFLSIASLLYIIMLMIVFFTKDKVKTSENKLFTKLLIVSFMSLISELYITLMPKNMDFAPFVVSMKLFLVLCVLWLSYFMEYVFIITRNNEKRAIIDYKQDYKKIYIPFWIITIIIMTIIMILPINFFDQGNIKYSYGPSVNIVFALSGIYTTIMAMYILKNIKNLKNRGYMPICFLVFLLIITAIVQKINPGLLLANTAFALVTSLMYHTIENPDIRMIKELSYAKAVAEKSQNATMKTLNEMSEELKSSIDKLTSFGYKKINKNDIDEVYKEINYIQKYSIQLADKITGVIDLAKISSGSYTLENEKYDTFDMIEELKYLLNCEKGNKKIALTTEISKKINPVVYGDKEKIKQTVVYLFSYIIDIVKNGNIHIFVDNMNVGRFCRLKFHFYIDNPIFSDYIKEDTENKVIYLKSNDDNIDYVAITKLLDLQKAKIDIKSDNKEITELTLLIDQKIMSEYELIENREENVNIKVKYFDASSKRILIVDDNRQKLKDIMILLKPYSINIETALNEEEMYQKLNEDKIYDLILIDDIIPKFNDLFSQKQDKRTNTVNSIIKKSGYDIPIIIMVTENNNNLEQKYLDLGFNDYLSKPVNKGNLNKVLIKYLKDIKKGSM